jgi:TolB-like protein/tetratricopeptide (TPR) repeat protein
VADVPRRRERFDREARAISSLNHPHICTLYDVGRQDEVDFLVMEYLEGDTLAARLAISPLPLDLALTRALEVASALDHAHGHGIIHRDLKPANIMLTATGAKLLDFGLAKFRPAGHLGVQDADVTSDARVRETMGSTGLEAFEGDSAHVTRHGALLGTIRYMAPEQIEGHDIDTRSDLFSFGTVLFEMLTGRRAFEGDSAATIREAILTHEPPPVSSLQPQVPRAIDDIVRRCLAKDPAERWQTAGDVLRDLKRVSESGGRATARTRELWRWGAAIVVTTVTAFAAWFLAAGFQRESTAPPPSQIRSIAVLPLENLSGDPEQEYFADGMTEQLIADLAKIGELRVISRTSVMRYRNTRTPIPAIARELRIDAIIEGSVVRVNDQVRITAKLIAGVSGDIIWARSFERDMHDVLALQSEVARAITSTVNISLKPQDQARLANARPVDPEIHRQVLLGRHHLAKATPDEVRKAIQIFDATVARDPSNALAYAGLGEAYMALSGFYVHPRDVMPKAKQAAETAIRLDDSLAEAHAALGFVHLVYDWDGPATEKALRRALDLNPTLATARLYYAAYLTTQARHQEAVQEIQRAVESDPLSTRSNAFATSLLLFTQRYDEAIEMARKGLEVEPNNAFALAFQGVAYVQQGRFQEAVTNMQRAEQLDSSPTILALEALVLAVAGQKDAAAKVIRRVEESTKNGYFCPYEIGSAYVSLGDADTAYRWFRKGLEGRADCMAWLGVEPWIDPFRSDPRYASLLREIGLDPRAR